MGRADCTQWRRLTVATTSPRIPCDSKTLPAERIVSSGQRLGMLFFGREAWAGGNNTVGRLFAAANEASLARSTEHPFLPLQLGAQSLRARLMQGCRGARFHTTTWVSVDEDVSVCGATRPDDTSRPDRTAGVRLRNRTFTARKAPCWAALRKPEAEAKKASLRLSARDTMHRGTWTVARNTQCRLMATW